MRRHLALLLLLPALAAADPARGFDYYILSLSWSPSWCEAEGDERDAPVCRRGAARGFTLHGLWPQYERGWPEFCATTQRDPATHETAAMVDLMGSEGLALHQWRKHGRCTGLDPAEYFDRSRAAFETLDLPPQDMAPTWTTAAELSNEIIERNPRLASNGFVITCRDGLVHEVRVCLSDDLTPRPCAQDVLARACPQDRIVRLPAAR